MHGEEQSNHPGSTYYRHITLHNTYNEVIIILLTLSCLLISTFLYDNNDSIIFKRLFTEANNNTVAPIEFKPLKYQLIR